MPSPHVPTTFVEYTGDGSTSQWSLPFQYISPEHVKCSVTLAGQAQVAQLDFTAPDTVQVTPAPAVGASVLIFRETPVSPLVNWASVSGESRAARVLSALQALYLAEEARSWAGTALSVLVTDVTDSHNVDAQAHQDIRQDIADLAAAALSLTPAQIAAGATGVLSEAAGVPVGKDGAPLVAPGRCKVIGAAYTVLPEDNGVVLEVTANSVLSFSGTYPDGFGFAVLSTGAYSVTVQWPGATKTVDTADYPLVAVQRSVSSPSVLVYSAPTT